MGKQQRAGLNCSLPWRRHVRSRIPPGTRLFNTFSKNLEKAVKWVISKQATKLFEVVKCHPTGKEVWKDFTKLYKSKIKWALVWINIKHQGKNNLSCVDPKLMSNPELAVRAQKGDDKVTADSTLKWSALHAVAIKTDNNILDITRNGTDKRQRVSFLLYLNVGLPK